MSFDETYDFVIVGSGAGSMSAALVMRQAGKSVLIIEKTQFVGGTTAKSGGVMWVPCNRFMDADGEPDSAEAALTYLDTLVGDDPDTPGTSHEKRAAYVTEATRMIEFLIGQGIKLERGSRFWPDYYDELPGGCKTSRTVVAKPFNKKELGDWEPKLRQGFMEVNARLDDGMQLGLIRRSWKPRRVFAKIALGVIKGKLLGRHYVTAGAALQGRMLRAALKSDVNFRTETAVSELIVEDERVAGVATSAGRIAARLGVLVNAGGFARNQVMRDKYMPGTRSEWSQTPEGDTGDMHVEMERIGAVLAQMDEMVGYQSTLAPGWQDAYVSPPGQSLTARPHCILVDQSGVRYLNEGGSYEAYCEAMLRRSRNVPAVPSWAIFDRNYVEKYQVANLWIDKKIPPEWISSGYFHQADTIEGLAKSISVDPEALGATIARWNGFVDADKDEDFHRGEREYDRFLGDIYSPNASLGRIDKGPFYAVPMVPGDVSTYGGVVTDAQARVVRADGTPIEGLYATGVSTASVMGRVYPGAGCSVAPSLTFGYIAARHAAGVGKQTS